MSVWFPVFFLGLAIFSLTMFHSTLLNTLLRLESLKLTNLPDAWFNTQMSAYRSILGRNVAQIKIFQYNDEDLEKIVS